MYSFSLRSPRKKQSNFTLEPWSDDLGRFPAHLIRMAETHGDHPSLKASLPVLRPLEIGTKNVCFIEHNTVDSSKQRKVRLSKQRQIKDSSKIKLKTENESIESLPFHRITQRISDQMGKGRFVSHRKDPLRLDQNRESFQHSKHEMHFSLKPISRRTISEPSSPSQKCQKEQKNYKQIQVLFDRARQKQCRSTDSPEEGHKSRPQKRKSRESAERRGAHIDLGLILERKLFLLKTFASNWQPMP